MAIPHAKPGEVIDLQPRGEAVTDLVTNTLIKTERLEVIRLIIPAGKDIPIHQVPGEITVQCLEGRVAFVAAGAPCELAAAQMLFLAGNEPHSLRGIENSSVLVTILLHHKL